MNKSPSIIWCAFSVFALALYAIVTANAQPPSRIVSVGGGLTEIIYALGAEQLLVGSDTTSYYPDAARHTTKVGYQRALSSEGILSLEPDLIMLTEDSGPPEVLRQLKAVGAKMVRFPSPRSVAGVKRNIEKMAALIHRQKEGQALIDALEEKYATLQEQLRKQPDTHRAIFILQHGGGAPMVAGRNTAADSMMTLAGLHNVCSEFEGYKPLTPESAVILNPDVILITDQGLAQAGGERGLLNMPGIALTQAAKDRRLIVMDALLLLGFGPRTLDAALHLNSQLN